MSARCTTHNHNRLNTRRKRLVQGCAGHALYVSKKHLMLTLITGSVPGTLEPGKRTMSAVLKI